MYRFIPDILELLGLFGIVGILAFVSWTKMLLGALMTTIGAFFPNFRRGESDHGHGTISVWGMKAALRGSLRFGVVFGGIVLIIGAILDGHTGWKKAHEQEETQRRTELEEEVHQFDLAVAKLPSNQQKEVSDSLTDVQSKKFHDALMQFETNEKSHPPLTIVPKTAKTSDASSDVGKGN